MEELEPPALHGKFRDGWTWLTLVTAARMYLFLLLALLGFALVPLVFSLHASVVQSGSMEPHIRPGDVVLTTPLPDGSPVPLGRVVRFTSPPEAEADGMEKQRLHRVVAVHDDGSYVTAGDANADVDSVPLKREQITGEARILVPFIGLPGHWITTRNILALALWALLTMSALVAMVLDEPPRPPGSTDGPSRPSRRALFVLAGAAAASFAVVVSRPSSTASFSARTANIASSWKVAVLAPLTLGRATGYALLASTGIHNSGFLGGGTSIRGSIGTSPGSSISGLYSWNVSGSADANNASARNGQTDAASLYATVGSRPVTATRTATLNGTISPGTYASSTNAFTISGTMTLDARGDSSALFIFKANSLNAATSSTIRLINGAAAKNVYWRIAGTITLASASTGAGNYLANGNVVLQNNSNVTGRIISLNGSINTASNDVTLP